MSVRLLLDAFNFICLFYFTFWFYVKNNIMFSSCVILSKWCHIHGGLFPSLKLVQKLSHLLRGIKMA